LCAPDVKAGLDLNRIRGSLERMIDQRQKRGDG
jgi:hypothetical protein